MITNELMTELVETLHMLSGDLGKIHALAKQESSTPEEIIQDYLDELEGDVYTFLHRDNLKSLNKFNLIDSQVLDLISILRQSVENLPKEKWKVYLFARDDDWHKIHQLAKKILYVIS